MAQLILVVKRLRGGRQKGAEAVSDFDFAGRLSYFGMLGWNFGASFIRVILKLLILKRILLKLV